MTDVKKYRKKPVVIEAMRFDGDNHDDVVKFAGLKAKVQGRERALVIITEEGVMTASPGDYVIKGVQGEYYPCKPDIFEQTYEPVGSLPSGVTVVTDASSELRGVTISTSGDVTTATRNGDEAE